MNGPAEPEPCFVAIHRDPVRSTFHLLAVEPDREQVEARIRERAFGRPCRIFQAGVPGFTAALFGWMRDLGLTAEQARATIHTTLRAVETMGARRLNFREITGCDPDNPSYLDN